MKTKALTYLLLLALGTSLSQNSVYQKKIDSITRNLNTKDLSYKERIQNLGTLVNIYSVEENYAVAKKYLDDLYTIGKTNNDTLLIGKIYKSYAVLHFYENKHEELFKYIDKAINTLNTIKTDSDDKIEALFECYTLKSDSYTRINNYAEANNAIIKASDYLPTRNDSIYTYAKIDVLNTQAYIYSEIENNSEALKNLNQALSLENDLNDDYGKANTYNAIAIIYSKQKEDEKAIEYYNLSSGLWGKLGMTDQQSISYLNIGISYFQLKDYEKTKENLFKAIDLGTKLNDKTLLSDSYLHLGKTFIAEGKTDLGLQNISRSLALAEEINSPTLIIDNLLVKAQAAKKIGDTDKTTQYLNEALDKLDKTETLELKQRVYKSLAENCKEIDFNKHIFFKNKHQKLSDSIITVQQKHKTEVLKAEFDNLKIKADLKSKEQDLLLAKEKEESAKTRLYLLILLATIFILALIIIIARQNKLNKTRKIMWEAQKEVLILKEENIKKEMDFKNQQITDFAIHISEKNDLLEKIKQKIKRISVPHKEATSQINDLILFINDDINQNKEKAQLYSEIDETTESFNHKINNIYDNLSEKEKKIATLVRLNHSSKQIALQLNISPASVDNYRSNLRKKMNVPKGTSLSKFIKEI